MSLCAQWSADFFYSWQTLSSMPPAVLCPLGEDAEQEPQHWPMPLYSLKKVPFLSTCCKTVTSDGPRSEKRHILTTLSSHQLLFLMETVLITIYCKVMKCQQQHRLISRSGWAEPLTVATAVGYGQQHWVMQGGDSLSSTSLTAALQEAEDGQPLHCGTNHARVTNVSRCVINTWWH